MFFKIDANDSEFSSLKIKENTRVCDTLAASNI
jgi:hypothetical protein